MWPAFSFAGTRVDYDGSFHFTAPVVDSNTFLGMRARFKPSTGERIQIFAEKNRMRLEEIGTGGAVLFSQPDYTATMEAGVDYRVRVRIENDRIRVWRNKAGEAARLIFDRDGLALGENDRCQFIIRQGSDVRFDNFAYHFWNNLHEFLKLSDQTASLKGQKP